MSPATHALDRRLYDLQAAHEAVTSSLQHLEAEGTFTLLASSGKLSGATASKARPALEHVADLWRGIPQLHELLIQVRGLRRSGPIGDDQATQLLAMLNSPVIAVPEEPTQRAARPPGTTRAMTPQDLLTALDQAVAPLREVVAEVDTAWREFVPRLERVAAEAERLAEVMPGSRRIAAARGALGLLPGRVIDDPLGAVEELAEIETALATAAEAREAVSALRSDLAAAADTLIELEAVLGEGRRALARCRVEITDAPGLLDPLDPEVVTGERGLGPWLDRLRRLVDDDAVDLAVKGLQSWRSLADQTLAAARQVAEANLGPLRRRQELHSLLRAARVKAGASGRAEDPVMTELARQADRALSLPCSLEEAAAQVDTYLAELRRSPTPAQAAVRSPAPPPAGPGEKEVRV